MAKKYITTTLPYVNADPHLGHATEFVRADALARFYKSVGDEVFLNTGTDEHGQKIYDKAREVGEDPQAYVDRYAEVFKRILAPEALNVMPEVHFIRTTDAHHKHAAQEMWRRCMANVDESGRPDIYKAVQSVKYCVGCELEKTDSELEQGKCPIHPRYDIEIREEENYFFRFSRYQAQLLTLYDTHPHFVVPDFRLAEIRAFVAGGLQDFSVSRLKSKMAWGVPVPDDEEHIMYVWFDALTNYISTTGWPEQEDCGGWWPGIQLAGKDNLRQQSAIWQAMLLSAGMQPSLQIFVGGFIISDGQKMSKSLGNVISPLELVARYGTDATRYLLLRHVHPFDDTDITWERLDEWYTAHLVNGLGNLVARVMKMAEDNLSAPVLVASQPFETAFSDALTRFRFDEAMNMIFAHIGKGDEYIQETQPFKMLKSGDVRVMAEGKEIITRLVTHVYRIAEHLVPVMPDTARIIQNAVRTNKKPDNLFARLD